MIDPVNSSAFETQATNIHKPSINTYPAFQPTLFNFTLSKEAAAYNSTITKKSGTNFSTSLANLHQNTQLTYGSDFRPVHDLETILHHHPLWPRAKDLLLHGCSTPLDPTDPKLEKEDMTLGLIHGNHKGIQNQAKVFQHLLEKDVTHVFALPITTECAAKLDSAS